MTSAEGRDSKAPPRRRKKSWAKVYGEPECGQICAAVSVPLAKVTRYRHRFDGAAGWYRLDLGRPVRSPPSVQYKRFASITRAAERLENALRRRAAKNVKDRRKISRQAARLLQTLGIKPGGYADDMDYDILVGLAGPSNDENAVIDAVEILSRLPETRVGAVRATRKLASRARRGAKLEMRVGPLVTSRGHTGNDSINSWIANLMILYELITGRHARTSTGPAGGTNEGEGTGPLLRFLHAAGDPIGISMGSDAWRSRVRTILKGRCG